MPFTIAELIEAIVAAVLAAGIAYGVYIYKDRQYQKLEAQYSQAVAQAQKKALEQTQNLNNYKAEADKDKQDAVSKVSADYQRTINSLRKRAQRPAVLPDPASVGQTCTGAELYREDAEFLAGEATRADKAIIDRDYYYGQYEHARSLLGGQKSDAGQSGTVSDTKPVP